MADLPDPFTPVVVWHSHDWQPDPAEAERPLYAFDYEALLGQCKTALERRRHAYPQMITKGTIKPDLAAQDILGWKLLCAEWQWVLERTDPETHGAGTGTLPDVNTLPIRRAAVDLALLRVDQELERGNRGHEILRQSHLNQALRWHLTRLKFGAPAVHFWADCTRRAQAKPTPEPEPEPEQKRSARA